MAISFEDSLKEMKKKNEESMRYSVMPMSLNDEVEAVASNEETWEQITDMGYDFYEDYNDDNMSTVSSEKRVSLHPQQVNITQETNSQYIPFKMQRYYDGFDLASTKIQIYFLNRENQYGISYAVNVYKSNESIKFAWLVDSNVTMLDGTVKFEIQAIGKNSKGDSYIWKTRPNEEMNIIKALAGVSFIEPDETWKDDFIARIHGQVLLAQNAAEEAKESASFASEQSALALQYAEEAKTEVESLKDGIEAEVQEQIDTTVTAVIDSKIVDALENYHDKQTVETMINDVSTELNTVKNQINGLDGLANFDVTYDGTVMTFWNGTTVMKEIEINNNPSSEWTAAYTSVVDEKIKTAKNEVQTNLDEYKAIVDADLAGLHEDIDGVPETLENDYYKKDIADATFATKTEVASISSTVSNLQSSVSTNKDNISALSAKVVELEENMGTQDSSVSMTYDMTYEEEKLTLWEQKGEDESTRTAKSQVVITGGNGTGTSSSLKIAYVTKTPLIVTPNDKVEIVYDFSGIDSSGDEVLEGVATWKVGSTIVATQTIAAGENSFDITDYVNLGTQKVLLTVTDDAGSLVTKPWTVQKIDVRLDSSFNDKLTYPLGAVSFDYTPYGAISKDVHFILDGKELGVVNTSVSGIPLSYDLPSQKHGSHLLEAYMTSTINSNPIESNRILKDIIWYDSESKIPVIGCSMQKFTARQYDTTNIEFAVFDPSTDTPTVILAIDGVEQSPITLTSNTHTWQYKSIDIGEHILTITCGETVKTLIATIEKLDIEVTPITAGLAFDFNPVGKSNNDTDKLWTDNNVSMSVSDNFDWINGGYQFDENGDAYFCVKAGTFATIDYNLFNDDAKVNGKEFKVIFKTTNIKKRDTTFLSCLDNGIGLDMKVEGANIYSSNGSLYSPYCEEDIIEFEFNINKSTDIPLVLTYEDGVGNRPMIYTSDASFWQSTPQPIIIGSNNCDVHIYRMKAYFKSLTDSDILANFIADARNADDMIDRNNRNQIYDENGLLSPEVLAEKRPDLRIIMLDAPWFTNDKDNIVDDTIIKHLYKNGDAVLDNWTCTGAKHSGQGTSSNEYGDAARNTDLIMDGEDALFTLGDGSTSKTITLTRTSVPTDYLNIKVNVASSECENNAQLARRYNQYNPFIRSAKFNNPNVKDTMEFYNCVIFIRERDEDISTHREFLDTNWHFYAIGNIGDSKKTDDTRVNDKTDPKECIIEIADYNVPLAEFPTGNADGSICSVDDWKEGNTAYDYLYAPYKYKDGKFKSFGSESYEFRYEMKGITEEQREVNINAWRELYKFIVTSTDEEFYAKLKEYFVVDSATYNYLFTERYTMVDNRAKNSFWHYGKVYITEAEAALLGDKAGGYIIDNEQAAIREGYRWDLSFAYDMDTSFGIDNTGKLVLTYGKEDTDYYVDDDPSSAYIYRAAKSTFFCRLRDLFASEMQAMFVDRENANAWSSSSVINQWDNAQNQFPEELWRLNIQRLYVRTYRGVSIDNSIAVSANPRFLTEMMNGRKKYQRRMFERNQELYMATKYFGKTATQDQIMMRFNNPESYVLKPDFTLYLTPYSNMYIGVKFGNVEPINFRAKAGVEYAIPYSIAADTADITLIYGASFIQAIGDLSKCYVGDNDFSKASRLQRLVIGSDVEGYSNTYMKKISLGNNKLLEYLDIKNTVNLSEVVDLSQCINLLELYAQGSGTTGVIFANGGKIQKFYIPAITSLTMKNLNYIEDFSIASFENLQTLIVEHTPVINTYEMVNVSSKLQTLRLIGMNWNIKDTSILDRVLTMRGVNNDGGEISQSVLTGNVHVPVIRQQQLYNYNSAWSDLNITHDTLIEQYPVTFVNDDGIVLEVQYVDKGSNAVDPTTRSENPLIPTKESSVSHDYTFAAWDSSLNSVFESRIIKATYIESLRQYTIKYVSKGIVLQESTGLYGENVPYTGSQPTYTAEETAYVYYLFNRWDKSGFIDGEKIVNAIFDKFEYTSSAFDGKELNDMSPVEIYAMTQLGIADSIIEDMDEYSIVIGNDVEYDDIESRLIISEKTAFNGSNHVDTGISLFDEDRDFVLAIDYEFLENNITNAVLAQCYQANGSNGFKLWYSANTDYTGAKFTWGTNATNMVKANKREMVIIRHIKGDNNLYIYNSNLDKDEIITITLDRTKITTGTNTLVFGCAKADDGYYENHAIGNINWCKLWYKDLGDSVCRDLAIWTHEKINFQVCGFRKYYLSNNASKRCSFSLLAKNLLGRTKKWNSTNSNSGGWSNSELNHSLNTRLYNAMPTQIKALLKQVKVPSSIGDKSTDIETSDCYITIPSLIEVDPTMTIEPYVNEGTSISYLTTNETRKRAFDGGDYYQYWLRSPNVAYATYVWYINADGSIYGYNLPYYEAAILILISF